MPPLSAIGISGLQVGEDVKKNRMPALHDPTTLRIAVISDLHAYAESSEPHPSYLKVLGTSDSAAVDPVRHLEELIDTQGLKADLLLSPGDLGDKASSEGIKYAWKCLHEIGKRLKTHLVAASSGNHDLDSRHLDFSSDPTETLQRLVPSYPLPNDADNNQYWARKFVVKTTENYRLAILNSSAYHGGKPEEIEYGRISNFTIERLKKELGGISHAPPVNIALCHHHPHQFPEISQEDDTCDVMKNGQKLLNLIGNGQNGDWIVIHGHKHHARIAYAQGGNSSPVVMGAGSFSAALYLEIQSEARNQFYLIELPLNNQSGLVGTIRAWDWTQRGWMPANNRSGLPAVCKFGCRDSVTKLAHRIDQLLGERKTENWKEMLVSIPEVEFLLPDDLDTLINRLGEQYKIKVERENGILKELGRKTR